MTQRELFRAVSCATGESVDEIAHRGFVPLAEFPYERDPEDLLDTAREYGLTGV